MHTISEREHPSRYKRSTFEYANAPLRRTNADMATRTLKQEHSCEEAQILEAYCARLTPARRITTSLVEPLQVNTSSLMQGYALTNGT